MSSINGVSGSGNPWAALNTQRQARMFAKADSDGSGSVDKTELSTMLSDISDKTGVSLGSNVDDTFSKMDSNGDGKLSSDELAQGMQSLMPPPPSTMDFAQSRSSDSSSQKSDDLFAKIDTNGDGSIDKSEMTAFTEKMKSDAGKSSSTGDSKADGLFSKLDTDGDGKVSKAEFEAGRPNKAEHGHGAHMKGAEGGPPPVGGAGKSADAGGTASASSDSNQTYDPLDTNKDGVVSEMERLVGQLKDVASTASSDGSDSSTSKQKIADLAKQLYEQLAAGWSQQSSSSSALSAVA